MILSFARGCRVGVWFGFVRSAPLFAVGTCIVLSFEVMPGLCCFPLVTLRNVQLAMAARCWSGVLHNVSMRCCGRCTNGNWSMDQCSYATFNFFLSQCVMVSYGIACCAGPRVVA